MIERYTLPEMGSVWSEENHFQQWLRVEVLACEAQAELGLIPPQALAEIKERAGFEVSRIHEIEEVTRHDVLAFTTAVAEKVGEASKYIHLGMTSSDVLDTALAVQMAEAADLLLRRLERLREVLAARAREHKYTLQMGRTHGVHAEPVTFGLKLAMWAKEVERCLERLRAARSQVAVGKISGAVGTFANINPRVEECVCSRLGLTPEPVSTQIVQRDRHAQFLSALALVGCSLEKFATEIRNLQRTEILEAEERFYQGQKGSSAMPHKRNPITAERVAGLARILRGNALASMEEVALWHERDLTHSSVERVIIPDSCILLDYMLAKFTDLAENLLVYPENMRSNVEHTLGLIFSQRVLLALLDKGLLREDAYALVQKNAMEAWHNRTPFREMVLRDKEIMSRLSPSEVEELFNYDYHTRQVDFIFHRAGLD